MEHMYFHIFIFGNNKFLKTGKGRTNAMLIKIKNNADIKNFHQQTCDCADGYMLGFKHQTDPDIIEDELNIYFQGEKKVELVFKKLKYFHYELKENEDRYIYNMSLFFYNKKIYFSTFDGLNPNNLLGSGGVIVVAREVYWRFLD